VVSLKKFEKDYLAQADWEVKENANENISYGNFLSYFLDKVLKRREVLQEYLPKEAIDSHFFGDLHIHKLPHSLSIPYCCGWSFLRILVNGLKTPTVISRPAKHYDTAISHLINFLFIATQEWTGANAVSMFDLYLAPFVRQDRLKYEQIRQGLQKMLFELNYPSRMGYQSPFTNITLVLDTCDEFLSQSAIIGGKPAGMLADYVDEAISIVKALCDLYMHGDAKHQSFTFPIPTLMLTRDFDWQERRWGELTDKIFQTIVTRGSFYLLNGYATNVKALYSMCCRLLISTEDLKRRVARGIWAIPDATGSVGVITINMPRIAYLCKGNENKFLEILEKQMMLARKILKILRGRYGANLRARLMPLTKEYLGRFDNHYNTIGVLGLPEACVNFFGHKEWDFSYVNDYIRFLKDILAFMLEKCDEFTRKDNLLYNIEETPAESTSYRLATIDKKKFKDIFAPSENGVVYYSNSIIPYYADVSLIDRIKYEAKVQNLFSGGVIMHIFLYETPDAQALKKFIRRVVKKEKIIYFSITPTISSCKSCGYTTVGFFETCPNCKKKMEIWSRIVGYYRPISTWNIGKKAEFAQRVFYGSLGSKKAKGGIS